MRKKYKLDQSFGPAGTAAGSLLFIAGLLVYYHSFYGLILVLLGAFVGFSSTGTVLDSDKKRIKFSNNLFGIIQTGKWIHIDHSMKIGLKQSNKIWTTYSSGNRAMEVENKDYRISLFDSNDNEIMEINKNNSLTSAIDKLEWLSLELGIDKI
jgi:hypothetical protein